MEKLCLKRSVLLIIVFLLCCLILETSIRLFGNYSKDGNFIFWGRVLKPYHLPIQTISDEAAIYESSPQTRIVYDSQLGWAPRALTLSRDGLYYYNSLGARVDPEENVEYSTSKEQGKLRILLLGDSYIHGEEVPFNNTFGYYLKKELLDAGVQAEVINLAVGAYGLDQALLRWRRVGLSLSADIVLLGLQFENIQRSVNIVRPLYFLNCGLPFSKPRYVLHGQKLKLINIPTLPPQQVIALMKDRNNNPELLKHELFFNKGNYQEKIWYKSRLIALISEILHPVELDPFFYDLHSEPAQLTLKLLDTFQAEIEKSGSQFMMVHVPLIVDLIRKRFSFELVYKKLLIEIRRKHPVILTVEPLLQRAKETSFFSLS